MSVTDETAREGGGGGVAEEANKRSPPEFETALPSLATAGSRCDVCEAFSPPRVATDGPALQQPQDDTLVVNGGGQNPTETIGDGDQPLDAAYDNQWTLSDVDVHQ